MMEEKTKQETAIWAKRMRRKYRLGLLTSCEKQKLVEIGFNFEGEDTAAANKILLLEMARRGEDKPSQETKIGAALSRYTRKNRKCYDPDFDKQIRELAPKWFEKSSDINKTKLLEMARRGEKRPNFKEKLGIVLDNYTRNGRGSYDPLFDKQIRQVAPHWFK